MSRNYFLKQVIVCEKGKAIHKQKIYFQQYYLIFILTCNLSVIVRNSRFLQRIPQISYTNWWIIRVKILWKNHHPPWHEQQTIKDSAPICNLPLCPQVKNVWRMEQLYLLDMVCNFSQCLLCHQKRLITNHSK